MNDALVVLVVLAALALSALGGWPLTATVLRVAARSRDAGDPEPAGGEAAEPAGAEPAAAVPSLRGGTWIGVLERLAVTTCLVAGYPAGIAFVIAVKGLGRYPEIRQHPETSERFVIGTLASMLWAVAVGAVARLLVTG